MTLRQIAGATKISIGVLEALERNDISRLPGGIFSRAFVRSYADAGVDVPVLMPLPWGTDRLGVVDATMRAAVGAA